MRRLLRVRVRHRWRVIIEREKQMAPAKARRALELQKIVARVEQGLSPLEAARLAAKATADAEAALAAAAAAETATAAATDLDDDDVASEVGEREGGGEEEDEELVAADKSFRKEKAVAVEPSLLALAKSLASTCETPSASFEHAALGGGGGGGGSVGVAPEGRAEEAPFRPASPLRLLESPRAPPAANAATAVLAAAIDATSSTAKAQFRAPRQSMIEFMRDFRLTENVLEHTRAKRAEAHNVEDQAAAVGAVRRQLQAFHRHSHQAHLRSEEEAMSAAAMAKREQMSEVEAEVEAEAEAEVAAAAALDILLEAAQKEGDMIMLKETAEAVAAAAHAAVDVKAAAAAEAAADSAELSGATSRQGLGTPMFAILSQPDASLLPPGAIAEPEAVTRTPVPEPARALRVSSSRELGRRASEEHSSNVASSWSSPVESQGSGSRAESRLKAAGGSVLPSVGGAGIKEPSCHSSPYTPASAQAHDPFPSASGTPQRSQPGRSRMVASKGRPATVSDGRLMQRVHAGGALTDTEYTELMRIAHPTLLPMSPNKGSPKGAGGGYGGGRAIGVWDCLPLGRSRMLGAFIETTFLGAIVPVYTLFDTQLAFELSTPASAPAAGPAGAPWTGARRGDPARVHQLMPPTKRSGAHSPLSANAVQIIGAPWSGKGEMRGEIRDEIRAFGGSCISSRIEGEMDTGGGSPGERPETYDFPRRLEALEALSPGRAISLHATTLATTPQQRALSDHQSFATVTNARGGSGGASRQASSSVPAFVQTMNTYLTPRSIRSKAASPLPSPEWWERPHLKQPWNHSTFIERSEHEKRDS